VVIWNIMSASWLRFACFATNTLLFCKTLQSDTTAIGTYENQKNMAITMNILSSNG
jgi:hypothetical protein